MTDELMPIGQFAEHFGVSLRLLRFYESKGLLKATRKQEMVEFGKRWYDKSQQDRMTIIQKFTRAGVSLDDIYTFLRSVPSILSPNANTWDRAAQKAALKLLSETQVRLAVEEDKIARQLGNNRNFRAEIHAE